MQAKSMQKYLGGNLRVHVARGRMCVRQSLARYSKQVSQNETCIFVKNVFFVGNSIAKSERAYASLNWKMGVNG